MTFLPHNVIESELGDTCPNTPDMPPDFYSTKKCKLRKFVNICYCLVNILYLSLLNLYCEFSKKLLTMDGFLVSMRVYLAQ